MPKKKQATKSTKKTKNNSAVKGILVLIGLLLLADLLIFGYMKFTVNYIRCGHAPLAAIPNGIYGGNNGYAPRGIVSIKYYLLLFTSARLKKRKLAVHISILSRMRPFVDITKRSRRWNFVLKSLT